MFTKITRILFVYFLILSSFAQAALIPTAPTLTIGGRVFTDLTNLITLDCYASGANNYCSFRLPNGSSGYPVTSGKTLTVVALVLTNGGSNAFNIGYANNDVGLDVATVPTTPIREFGFGGGNTGIHQGIASAGAENIIYPNFTVPATKILFVQNTGAVPAFYRAYGYEN